MSRQPTLSFHFTLEKNSFQITSRRRQQQVPELEIATIHMSVSAQTTSIDWRLRYETLEYDHQIELERVRLHYEHELKEKVAGK